VNKAVNANFPLKTAESQIVITPSNLLLRIIAPTIVAEHRMRFCFSYWADREAKAERLQWGWQETKKGGK